MFAQNSGESLLETEQVLHLVQSFSIRPIDLAAGRNQFVVDDRILVGLFELGVRGSDRRMLTRARVLCGTGQVRIGSKLFVAEHAEDFAVEHLRRDRQGDIAPGASHPHVSWHLKSVIADLASRTLSEQLFQSRALVPQFGHRAVMVDLVVEHITGFFPFSNSGHRPRRVRGIAYAAGSAGCVFMNNAECLRWFRFQGG